MTYSIEQIIASSYVRYTRLADIINACYAGSSATKVNLFIDVGSCTKSIYNDHIFDLTSIQSEQDTAMAGLLINMAAHYRRFFRSRYKVESDIYFVFSHNFGKSNRLYLTTYNDSTMKICKSKIEIQELENNNFNLLRTISQYLPDISFNVSTFETSVLIQYIIDNVAQKGIPNIIVTKDIMALQVLANNTDNDIIIRPKKSGDEDVSYAITRSGVLNYLANSRNIKMTDEVIENTTVLDSGFLSFILASSGLKERNVSSILTITSVLKELRFGIDNGLFSNGYHANIADIYTRFPDKKMDSLYRGRVDDRFKAIDLQYQLAMLSFDAQRFEIRGAANLYDPNGIHQLAEMYFKKNPLDLQNL